MGEEGKAKDPPKVGSGDDSGTPTKRTAPPKIPPLEASARRLEKLLGGGGDKALILYAYTNPAKVVRRWLGTSSGAAGNATLTEIRQAATSLLDDAGEGSEGRKVLSDIAEAKDSMDVGEEDGKEEEDSSKRPFLSSLSAREVECWLISLAVRILWRDDKKKEAFALAQQGIVIALKHIDVAAANVAKASGPSMSSLFPLLARLFRLRSLVAESLQDDPSIVAKLRQELVQAHGMACLRRDVDTQATLLNLMLRDLLNASEGKATTRDE